jgi:D-tyrosyl-tRNA(Tyr) deacylase
MKALVQRVSHARVTVAGRLSGEIAGGLLIYLGCELGDTESEATRLAARVVKLRIFPDAEGRANLDLRQTGGAVLLVAQFTLAADLRKGNRPSFTTALPPEPARALVALFCRLLEQAGIPVGQGEFGAEMAVESLNYGPATYLLQEPSRP